MLRKLNYGAAREDQKRKKAKEKSVGKRDTEKARLATNRRKQKVKHRKSRHHN